MSEVEARGTSLSPGDRCTFVMPVIGRSGMCNELFPWARAEIFAARYDLKILAPSWVRFRIGPYLRREPEKRRYGGLFRSALHIHGWQRFRIRLTGISIPEREAEAKLAMTAQRTRLIEFSGMEGMFAPLAGHTDFVRMRLREMTRKCYLPSSDGNKPYIAMHVRRGDQTRLGLTPEELEKNIAQYTPLRWFISMAKAIRSHRELDDVPILVFTDGSLSEIVDLLRVPGVQRPPVASPISDLWMLAQSRLLFASGYSTFSTWASFLGGMPTIYATGKLQRVQSDERKSTEMELGEYDILPNNLLRMICG